jgi:murein DD-endopeptidase MepM/ murein hydrolase activator NlpD
MAAQAPPKKFEPKTQPSTTKSPIETRGHVSAQGVLAELETIEPALRKHQQEAAQKLTQTLTEKVKTVLPTFTRTRFDDATLTKIATEIATESAPEILENLPKIQDPTQIPQLTSDIADVLAQNIAAHSDLEGKLKTGDEETFNKLTKNKQIQEVAPALKPELEKVAVLAQINHITNLENPNQQIRSVINIAVDHTVELHDPLASPKARQAHQSSADRFLKNYVEDFKNRIAPQLSGGNIPNFTALQHSKSASFDQAIASEKKATPKGRIDPTAPTAFPARIGFILGLDPGQSAITDVTAALQIGRLDRFALKAGLVSNPTSFYQSALSHDQEQLKRTHKEITEQVERLKNKRVLSYSERKEYLNALRFQRVLGEAISFRSQKPKLAQNWMALVRGDLAVPQYATYTQMAFSGQLPGVFAPASLAGNQVLARNTLSLLSPKFGLGDLWGSLKESFMSPTKFGMGRTIATKGALPLMVANAAGNILKRIAKGGAALFGGLALYFLGLGKAAFTGFVIGAAIGGSAGFVGGAVLGLQIALATGPFAPVVAIVTVPLGALGGGFVFGAVGGLAGGLIALGIAAGSTTMVSMGVGAGIGGTVGAYAGGVAGATLGTTLVAACAIFTGGTCAFLAPIIPTFTFVGATLGAVVGAFIGAGIGYVIGHYILPVFKGTFDAVGSLLTGGANAGAGTLGAIGGLFGSIGSFFTGLAAGAWGGITGVAGGAFGLLSGAANFIVGGLSSISIPASVAAIPVAGGLGAVVIGGTIVGIVTATSFFNPEGEAQLFGTGDNEFFTVTKKAEPDKIPNNDDLPKDIKFTITLKAKETKLTNISITDELNVDGKNGSFLVDRDNSNNLISPPCSSSSSPPPTELEPNDNWSCEFTITATEPPGKDFRDSVVTNTVSVTTTPEGKSPINGKASAFVIIGSPPSNCPTGWPTDSGRISQGPQGPTSHADLYSRGAQAIDIVAPFGAPAYATFTGIVVNPHYDIDPGYGIYVDVQGTCKGAVFRTRWAHLNSIDSTIAMNSSVVPGQIIGRIDHTGLQIGGGDHLHYEFTGLSMTEPYIPITPDPLNCEDGPYPCSISW